MDNFWPGWKAKFLSSNAASLEPERAQAILDEFLREHPEFREPGDASQEGQIQGDGFV